MRMRRPEDELAELEQSSLRRSLPTLDRALKNFSSNDYLGLSEHPEVKRIYKDAIDTYGSGAKASRLVCGGSQPHFELEKTIATAKASESAITFSTGYATSLGTITAILKKGDTVILDKLCHASLIDGARMSGATLRVFPHNHLAKLEALLASREPSPHTRTLVITESIFSMDGDTALLNEITKLTKKYDALLMVDEAHGLGILGNTGMGLTEKLHLQSKIDFQMGTMGKAVGVAGGYIASSQAWVDLITNKARSLIYSTAPPPGQAAAAQKALHIIQSEEGEALRKKLWNNIHIFHEETNIKRDPSSAIIPLMVGDSKKALAVSAALRKSGYLIPAIRFPTVPKDTARLRVTLSATDTAEPITQLAHELKKHDILTS